ncbi:MAG: phage virion morphogenesis protein [Sodalis sp. (in: enterobacteria)]
MSAGGQLRGSVTTDYSSHHAALGSNLDYARIHQLGGKAGR